MQPTSVSPTSTDAKGPQKTHNRKAAKLTVDNGIKKVAEKLALNQLSGEDLHRVSAIAKGRGTAQKALDEAFDTVRRATVKRTLAGVLV